MEFILGTAVAILGLAVAVFTALRSRQLSHPNFSVRVGEQSVRSRRLTKNPRHLVYLTSLEPGSTIEHCQLAYAIRNTSKKTLQNINVTIDVPDEFCMPKSKITKVLSEHGMSEMLEHEFFKSRRISSYLKKKRVEYCIDQLGPKQQATLGEGLDLTKAKLPKKIPIEMTLNTVFDLIAKQPAIQNFVPLHISVSAQDIEPKTETFFLSVVDGDIASIANAPRKKRMTDKDGEYKEIGIEIPIKSINLDGYIDAFWLGNWPSGYWFPSKEIFLPWRRPRMFRTEDCHIVPINSEVIEKERELNHPFYSGEIAYFPMKMPNFDYLSTEFDFKDTEQLMAHLGFRRTDKFEIWFRKLSALIVPIIMLIIFLIFDEEITTFLQSIKARLMKFSP